MQFAVEVPDSADKAIIITSLMIGITEACLHGSCQHCSDSAALRVHLLTSQKAVPIMEE